MQNNNQIVQSLRARGYRLTPQRIAILQILEENGGHLSPAKIYACARERMPGLTETTVYRTLDFLSRTGMALVAHVGDGHLVYETAAHRHHHLICRECGATVEIGDDLLETLFDQFRERTGFQIDVSHVTFFGHCPDCAGKQPPANGN
jgi:Fur family ferric uptake transcriptional regulator